MAAPEPLTYDDNRLTSRVVVFAGERATQDRSGSQRRKEVSSDGDSCDALGIADASESKGAVHGVVAGNMLEALLMITPREEVCNAEGARLSAASLLEICAHEALWLGKWQRPQ